MGEGLPGHKNVPDLAHRGEGEIAGLLGRLADNTEIDAPLLEKPDSFGGGAVGNVDFHPRIFPVEGLKIGKKEKLQGHVAGPDADFPTLQVHLLVELFLPLPDLLQPRGHMAEQGLPLAGELHPLGGADEQGTAQLLLQPPDIPADRGLREIQSLGGQGNAFIPGDLTEHPIQIQAGPHRSSSLRRQTLISA